MPKIKCPICLSRKVLLQNIEEINHKYGEKTEFVVGTRAFARKKKVLISFDKVSTYKCTTCGHEFINTKRVTKN